MTRSTLTRAASVAALAVGLAACSDSPVETALLSEQQITDDVAVTSGEAIANDVGELILNETFAGLPGLAPGFSLFGMPPGVTVTRTRTCFDANDQAQQQCDPATTDYVTMTMQMDGAFTRTVQGPARSESLSVSLHRTRTLTISNLLGQETFRVHDGHGTGADTTVMVNNVLTREVTEASLDSVQGIRFDLPRATNPWPVAGTMVRRVSGTITLTGADRSGSRSFSRRVSVTFPADAQGNVPITINDRTCNLNLVTHRVTCD